MRQTNVHLTLKLKNMEEEFYTCEFCQTKFIPKRRKAQKFCSQSCRSKNFHHKNKHVPEQLPKVNQTEILEKIEKLNSKKNSVDKMSLPGVGNAAAGALAVESLKAVANAFVQEKNKPATKGDIQELKKLLGDRYRLIKNYKLGPNGEQHYFDLETNEIVYLPIKRNQTPADNII
jgi:hypothetical protein